MPDGLAMPDTRVTSERYWCQSAASITRTLGVQAQTRGDTALADGYAAAHAALAAQAARLAAQEEGTDG